MITVGVREHEGAHGLRVQPQRAHVAQQDITLAAGIEEQWLFQALHQAGEAPIGLQTPIVGRVVIQYGNCEHCSGLHLLWFRCCCA